MAARNEKENTQVNAKRRVKLPVSCVVMTPATNIFF